MYVCVGYEEIWWTEPVATEVSSTPVPQLCKFGTAVNVNS